MGSFINCCVRSHPKILVAYSVCLALQLGWLKQLVLVGRLSLHDLSLRAAVLSCLSTVGRHPEISY